MDLISIRRKYKNRRNIIIVLFLIVIIALSIVIIQNVQQNSLNEKIYLSYNKQCEQAKAKDEEILEQKRLEEEKRLREKLPNLTEQGKANLANIYKADTKKVYLTFDDGPSKTVTIPILDILKQENIKATFFVLGSRAELYPDILKREYDEGHYIASHGYSHVYSQIYSSPQAVLDEYNKSVIAIRNAIEQPEYNPHLFRFPGGYPGGKYFSIKQEAGQILEQNGVLHIDWNALTSDAAGAKTTEEFLSELNRTVGTKQNVVVLMHDAGTKKATAEALPQIIAFFRERGYEFDNFYSIIK